MAGKIKKILIVCGLTIGLIFIYFNVFHFNKSFRAKKSTVLVGVVSKISAERGAVYFYLHDTLFSIQDGVNYNYANPELTIVRTLEEGDSIYYVAAISDTFYVHKLNGVIYKYIPGTWIAKSK